MNGLRICRRMTPILFVGCVLLAIAASATTLLSLRRSDQYFAARQPVEARRRAIQNEMDQLQRQPAEAQAGGEETAPPPPEESARIDGRLEALRRERYALYDQRRTLLAKERADVLLNFHDAARLPMIHLQIFCLVALVASRLLETALATAPQRGKTLGGAVRVSN